ncbi:hypothetical protein C5467_24445 [Photorhabdus khanii subsp. guanajuatensis]|uniref:Uncharacterized protein n=1 Tax=Photorhabdus khanii subsp. guanajuatensis TaxID=2100166 RepID=A0A4R4IM52_9GAMM|nr:hypothetical protein C5467_24445 [Photorhabdus khanii subsp. guanajuatensis]
MFDTNCITKTFIFAVTKQPNFEQKVLVKVRCVARNYSQAKNELSELLAGYSIVWMGQINNNEVHNEPDSRQHHFNINQMRR